MAIKTTHTEKAPAAIGPYSQATVVGNLVFTSGQIPIIPESGELITDDIKKATRQSLENVKEILENSGSSLDKVAKVNIFISDMNNFAKINEVYSEYFNEHKPARSCVEVAKLPKDSLVEIEAIAEVE